MEIDEFCGKTYNTPKGGILTVIGIIGKSSSGNMYAVHCNICNNDTELFPDYFKSPKWNLENGNIPCRCVNSCKLTDKQQVIIINRIFRDNEKYKNLTCIKRSELKQNKKPLYEIKCSICNSDSEMFPNLFLSSKCNILNGNIPCGCAKRPLLDDRQKILAVNRIIKSNEKYSNLKCVGISNEKMKNGDILFNIECSICNSDHELFPEYFTITKAKLSKGIIPCGCSIAPRLNDNQKIIVINRILQSNFKTASHKCIGVINSTIPKFKIICPICNDNENKSPYIIGKQAIVDGYIPCECSEPSGYDKNKPGYLYIFKYKFKNKPLIYKFGITNKTPHKRSKGHISGIVKSEIELSECVFEKHYENGNIPRLIELKIKEKYKGVSDWLSSGNTETVSENDLNDLLNIINLYENN